jgi:hypothetical protein
LQRKTYLKILVGLIIILAATVAACTSGGPSSPVASSPAPSASAIRPGGGAVIQSDSVITGKIAAVRRQSSGYPWEIDVTIQNSVDVGNLPNPTKDKVGQTITVKADEDLSSLKAGQVITAHVKYVGDVPQPGISLFIFNIDLQAAP